MIMCYICRLFVFQVDDPPVLRLKIVQVIHITEDFVAKVTQSTKADLSTSSEEVEKDEGDFGMLSNKSHDTNLP